MARHWPPGLIDSHVHPVGEDYTPRQQQLGWIDSRYTAGYHDAHSARRGTYAGPPQGYRRPQGPMAIASQRWYEKISAPSGVKCTQGPLLLKPRHGRSKTLPPGEKGEWAKARVTLLGGGRFWAPSGWQKRPAQMVDGRGQIRDAKHDPHCAPDPGSGLIDADYGARDGATMSGAHQWRTLRPARRPDHLSCGRVQSRRSDCCITENGRRRVCDAEYRARSLGKLDQLILAPTVRAGVRACNPGIMRMVADARRRWGVPAD